MLEHSEYTIYGDGDVSHTDGEPNDTLARYCDSLSYRVDWDFYAEEDEENDTVVVVRVLDDQCIGEIFPGEGVKSLWLPESEWKTGENRTW